MNHSDTDVVGDLRGVVCSRYRNYRTQNNLITLELLI